MSEPTDTRSGLAPPADNLHLRIENVHDRGDGKVSFEVSLSSKLRALGRLTKWAKGVRLYSISVEADADVKLRIWCEVGIRFDLTKLPPDVVLVPTVTQADLDIVSFHVDRISKLDGPLAEQLGRSLRHLVLKKIDEKRHKLPGKINRQIAKNDSKMRLSLSDFATRKWKTLTNANVVAAKKETAATQDATSSPETFETAEQPPPGPILPRPRNQH